MAGSEVMKECAIPGTNGTWKKDRLQTSLRVGVWPFLLLHLETTDGAETAAIDGLVSS